MGMLLRCWDWMAKVVTPGQLCIMLAGMKLLFWILELQNEGMTTDQLKSLHQVSSTSSSFSLQTSKGKSSHLPAEAPFLCTNSLFN